MPGLYGCGQGDLFSPEQQKSDYAIQRLALGGLGILTDKDLDELSAGTRRVYFLMSDKRWHYSGEIRKAAGKDGNPASEGLRRLRELRDHFSIEKERRGPGRCWAYRLVPLERVEHGKA